jgi:hypothetical protein
MTMIDDQGGVEPVMPTDVPDKAVPETPVEPEQTPAEPEPPTAASVPASRSGQGNFPSARVRRREDQMDAAAILRWEHETGQVWADTVEG